MRIAIFSLLAIGMTAVLELPTLAALQTTQSSVNAFPKGFRLNIASENTWKGLLDAMRQVAGNMGGALEPNFKEGLPNLYCGVFAVQLTFLMQALCNGCGGFVDAHNARHQQNVASTELGSRISGQPCGTGAQGL